jgi:hypothetical protein
MKIKQANKVQTTCLKHGFCDHWEYVKEDGKIVYKCTLCYKEKPYAYPLYGKQVAQFKDKPKPETEPQQYGRLVA